MNTRGEFLDWWDRHKPASPTPNDYMLAARAFKAGAESRFAPTARIIDAALYIGAIYLGLMTGAVIYLAVFKY